MAGPRVEPLTVNTVDLFCGCGGLSLGFEAYREKIQFRVIMALDNDPKAILCYNANLSPHGSAEVARLCDLTWFGHTAEVLLYYLDHYSRAVGDDELRRSLDSEPINVQDFLARLRHVDEAFATECRSLAASSAYEVALGRVDSATFVLASCVALFTRLGLEVPTATSLASIPLIWSDGFTPDRDEGQAASASRTAVHVIPEIRAALQGQWEREIETLSSSAKRTARGQHKPVPRRLKGLSEFFTGSFGKQLKVAWLDWRAQRDSLRLRFVLEHERHLTQLYAGERRVGLLLGGPPCKGFSRIGRARIANLRDQGVHAWIDSEYGDQRNALFHKYVLFIEALQPNVFLFENVRHFQSALRTPNGELDAATLLEEAIRGLSDSEIEYVVQSTIIKAKEHGVPQDRERFFMVGAHSKVGNEDDVDSVFSLPKFKEEVPLLVALQGLGPAGEFRFGDRDSCGTNHKSAAYTLVDPGMPESFVLLVRWIRQPALGASTPSTETDAHIYRRPRPDDLGLYERFAPGKRWMDYKLSKSPTRRELDSVLRQLEDYLSGDLPEKARKRLPAGSSVASLREKINEALLLRLMLEETEVPPWFGEENHLLLSCYLDRGTDQHGDWFERLSATRPCKTIVAHIGKDTYGYIHPWEPRPITMREAARIQAFPDWFSFGMVGVVEGYSMIGNAVPPLLAHMFAGRLAAIHDEVNTFGTTVTDRVAERPSRLHKAFQRSLWELNAGEDQ